MARPLSRHRPLIGVTASRYRGRLMWLANALSLWIAGARPIRMTAKSNRHMLDRLDGLLIGGGDDLAAHLYDGDVSLDIRIDRERDQLELDALDRVVPRGLPILGVCRGAQLLNVYFGGNLHQDIHAVFVEAPRMRTMLPRKTITLDKTSRLARLFDKAEVSVNSLHHQSIDRLAPNLHAVGHDRWGIVQAVEDRSRPFLYGVQWHPEFLFYQRSQLRLFAAFARCAARQRANEIPEKAAAETPA